MLGIYRHRVVMEGDPLADVLTLASVRCVRINQDIAIDPLWSGPAEKYRAVALQYGFRSTWSVPLLSKDGDVLGTFGLYRREEFAGLAATKK
jgi:hypothetical protein